MDADASYILTEPASNYSIIPGRERQQRASSMQPTSTVDNSKERQTAWRKSHSTEKYDYRDVNLNGLVPEKVNKRIPLPEDYWKVHEEDVKLWKIGSGTSSLRKPRDLSKDSDWECNVKKYENLGDHSSGRLQYYTSTDDNGNRKNSLDGEKKEIKFPGLKAFKSASMRLPGQKSSLHEVHQLLRNKFNRLNAGLRKKRTMSVQEVFQSPTSQSEAPTSPQFYVPSPTPVKSPKCEATLSENGPSSLPHFINSTPNAKPKSSALLSNTMRKAVPSLRSESTVDKRNVIRSQSYRTKHRSCDLETERPVAGTEAKTPQFQIGGRVSLRDQAKCVVKITNVVRDKMRMRPRSHSPIKNCDGKPPISPEKTKKNRESFGFFERINRIMSIHHLPPSHANAATVAVSNNNNNTSSSNNNHKVRRSIGDGAASPTRTKSPAGKKGVPVTTVMTTSRSSESVQTKKPHQLPETISVRDRKSTKQVRPIRMVMRWSRICIDFQRDFIV